ncbi:MAG TPA: FixH family protein, partial [Planctomycetota bacterium]
PAVAEPVSALPEAVPAPATPWLDDSFRRGESGAALVAWRAVGGELPRNRHFELEVWVVRDGAPVRGAELIVRADMPEHGHGMNVEPRALLREDGSFRVKGMLLHMAGAWVLTIHVTEPGRFHSAAFPLEIG